ncbi:hypothetical protein CERZMDRAFT_91655 [Cercospora zeae-maydis SCOH1-5]|uniref:Uncharacterized protein n=1 Tax=Cercospora zeae-maydis SCOH1-5 TaxID=717836 RepID=A0A6A6F4E1_9PEZI|nr:hypothetical protein CERZMDRAFT_91655 [Cercospora zeae-maydis SCOH1-5]
MGSLTAVVCLLLRVRARRYPLEFLPFFAFAHNLHDDACMRWEGCVGSYQAVMNSDRCDNKWIGNS